MASLGRRLVRALTGIVVDAARRAGDEQRGRTDRRRPSPQRAPEPATRAYAGDYTGLPELTYAPVDDDLPDPGEVVWAWVPYEEDHSRGKDRPVLVVGRHREHLLALPMTSKDHDRDAEQEASQGRHWCDIGSGAWDARGRPSEVRVDRVLQLDPGTVRRIGATLPPETFALVAQAVRARRA
ncbi:type II toxin-antitoxin system PemK/MazF family toxin [Arsenicicoccus sp. oral taxon 190]|uniref:type II toxin-antitoxin system PemK/MazF family toxin n=1 Tax=Arsenicicoccus sp. oral taxon 190 TaxID=1658671 RepID=UPI00067A00FB|nr:type II toxin-antitoxin system PemK/MazF family toxin [Arsenicicoccus sp. oral taxon 190]AKT52173.1 hypothetical protein ADJ73_14430 [Arsenicicoccus sp. oral taxon 190]